MRAGEDPNDPRDALSTRKENHNSRLLMKLLHQVTHEIILQDISLQITPNMSNSSSYAWLLVGNRESWRIMHKKSARISIVVVLHDMYDP